MSTPHNDANINDIAKVVLMPGDPLRAKFIADNFLENPVQFNTVRNMFGYTGTYKGKKVSVMGSGMGMASIGIYSYELFKFYDVDTIIRIGTAGSYKEEIDLFDIVVVDSAYSESTFQKVLNNKGSKVTYPSKKTNNLILRVAEKEGYKVFLGRTYSSDVFYHEKESKYLEKVKQNNCLCVEMESFALFANAKALKKNAACILTISDSLISHKETTALERQTSFTRMMKLALECAIKIK